MEENNKPAWVSKKAFTREDYDISLYPTQNFPGKDLRIEYKRHSNISNGNEPSPFEELRIYFPPDMHPMINIYRTSDGAIRISPSHELQSQILKIPKETMNFFKEKMSKEARGLLEEILRI